MFKSGCNNTKKNRGEILNLKSFLWNPLAFFISFFMSLIMPIIFGTLPGHMTLEICLMGWPERWVVAYLIVTILVQPTSIRLSQKFFNFPPVPDNGKRI